VIIPNRIYLADAFARLANRRTLIFCDPKIALFGSCRDSSKVERVHHDVDDFDAIRRHLVSTREPDRTRQLAGPLYAMISGTRSADCANRTDGA
jgi:hypothetical protein